MFKLLNYLLLFFWALVLCVSIEVKTIPHRQNGFIRVASYGKKDRIYVISENAVDYLNRFSTPLFSYSIKTQYFALVKNIPEGIELGAVFSANEPGELYFFTKTRVLFKIDKSHNIYPVSKTDRNVAIYSYPLQLNGTSNVYFVESEEPWNTNQIQVLNLRSNVTTKLTDIRLGAGINTVITTDGTRTLFVLGGKNGTNFIVRNIESAEKLSIETMNVDIPIEYKITNVVNVGKYVVFVTKTFELVTVDLRLQRVTSEDLRVQNPDEICRPLTATYIESNKTIYTFASKRFNKDCSLLIVNICPNVLSYQTEENVTALVYSGRVLVCPASIFPKHFVYWKRNEEIITNGKYDTSWNLILSSVTEQDVGNYSCHAESLCGTQVHYVRLFVKQRGSTYEQGETSGNESNPTLLVVIGVLVICTCILIASYCTYRRKNTNYLFTGAEVHELLPDFEGCPEENYCELSLQSFEIQRNQILGQGEFGIVYKGLVHQSDKTDTVALKTVKTGTSHRDCKEEIKSLLDELKVIIRIGKHPNIVGLVGAYTRQVKNGILYVVIEYCPNGSLASLLVKSEYTEDEPASPDRYVNIQMNEFCTVTSKMLCKWALEIATGMNHIASKNIIHSDLAARNVLVAADMSIRITDFGLSRRLENYANYVKTGREPLPWRWMALESLEHRNFSTKSDVWSYGVTLWEMYSMGKVPYGAEVWSAEFVEKLMRGEKLPKPEFAPEQLHKKMLDCWMLDPIERPGFEELATYFRDMYYKQNDIIYVGGFNQAPIV